MFELINQFLGAAGLRNPTLDVLNQDGALYNTLLYQPREGIAWGADFVRIADRERGIQKFRSFIDLASERNVELAITPEYSCPWEVITELIGNETFPEENKLWILGCESIKAQALHDLMAAHNEITWITEDQK